jgi:hypothetical protein
MSKANNLSHLTYIEKYQVNRLTQMEKRPHFYGEKLIEKKRKEVNEIFTKYSEETTKKYEKLSFAAFIGMLQKEGLFLDKDNNAYTVYDQQLKWLDLYSKKAKVSALLASRDKGKTEIGVIAAVSYLLVKNRKLTIAIVSRTRGKSKKIIKQIKRVLTKLGFNSGRSESVIRLSENNATENTVEAFGVQDGGIRGDHYHYIVMDDPLSSEDYYSKANQMRANTAFDEALDVIGRQGNLVVISQLISLNDFIWQKIKNRVDDKEVFLMESWLGDIPEIEQPLEVLEQKHDKNHLARNYLGNLELTDERPFKDILILNEAPTGRVLCVIDPAKKTGEDSDNTAICLIWRAQHGRLIILGETLAGAYDEFILAITSIAKQAKEVWYEDNSAGTALKTIFKNMGIYANAFTSKGNKQVRIGRHTGNVKFEMVALSSLSSPAFIAGVQTWSATSKYDDEADVMAMAIDLYDK